MQRARQLNTLLAVILHFLGKAQCVGFPVFFLDLMVLDSFLFPLGLTLTGVYRGGTGLGSNHKNIPCVGRSTNASNKTTDNDDALKVSFKVPISATVKQRLFAFALSVEAGPRVRL